MDNTMNEFEKYPELTEMMREYASFGHFSNWQRFTEVINDALQKATEQSSPDGWVKWLAGYPNKNGLYQVVIRKTKKSGLDIGIMPIEDLKKRFRNLPIKELM
jgi:arabinogalactan endo-1,4-beta-galactosidase